MSLIVDSSIAVKWVVEEPASDRARALYLSEECWAPSLIMAEVGNALWKKQRMKIVGVEQASAALRALPDRIRLFDLATLAPRALGLAVELDHAIYDCFYLALAERERAPMVSADERLLRKVNRLRGIEVRPL
jgi:predicted nucleic acid-binding protein